MPYIILGLICGFIRLPLGVWLNNKEFGENKGIFDYTRSEHIMFVFYWWTVKNPKNKRLALILNILLPCWLVIIFIPIIILTIFGDIK